MLLDLLLPRRCVACGRGGETVCAGCFEALRRIGPPLCARCGAPTAWPVERCRECSGRRLGFRTARAAVEYDDAVRALVAGWKEHGLRRLAALAAEIVVDAVPRPDVDAIVPVPPDPERLLRRGHHPAHGLAVELCRRWELPVLDLLGRRAGERQRGLSREARRRNVAGAFAPIARPPAQVLLVDDVYTSGATASAAASALRARVHVVTFARAIRTL